MRNMSSTILPSRLTGAYLLKRELQLIALTFLMIYGPKVGSWQSAFGDVISWISLFLVLYGYFGQSVHLYIKRKPIVPLGLLVILLHYSALVCLCSGVLANGDFELFYPLKFTRSLLNFGGAFALCGIYYKRYGSLFTTKILQHIFFAASLHALIMILEYINDDFRRVVFSLTGLVYQKTDVLRVPGLTISFGTLSITQGFAFMAFPLIAKSMRGIRQNLLFVVSVLLIAASLFLAGRSGFYMTLPLTLFVLGVKNITARPLSRSTTVFRILLLVVVVYGISRFAASQISEEVWSRFEKGTLYHLLEPYHGYRRTKVISIKGIEHLKTMYFLPDDFINVVFGSSISGRGDVYVQSDVGYVLSIFGIGILGTLLMIAFYIYVFILAFRIKDYDKDVALLLFLFTVVVTILNLKEQTLLTRHAFTITVLLFSSWYFFNPDNENCEKEIQ